MHTLKKRNLIAMGFLMLITSGLYIFYWLYKTKHEINSRGGKIPPFWFCILPFFNVYFDFRYAQDFVRHIRKEHDTILEWAFFCLLLFLPVIAPFVIQAELNAKATL